MAESANEHIRVSEETKERLRRRKQDDESFNDVITRLLDEDRDLLAGFGAADDRDGETLAATVARRKERSQQRIDDLTDSRENEKP
ncbi:MAG: antitoxin VapB family protein [Halovenus sp.]